MSLRMPLYSLGEPSLETGASVLETELLAERAASLGNAGRDVENAIAALRKARAGEPGYADRLRAAATAVYQCFVQRELNGFTDHEDVIAQYGIGREVLARLGQS